MVLELPQPAYGEVPPLPEQFAAAARDLRWTAAHLRGGIVGPAFGAVLEYKEETLCRFAADFSFKVDDLAGVLERFVADWRSHQQRS